MDHTLIPMFAIPVYASEIKIKQEFIDLVESEEYKRLEVNNGHLSKNTHILHKETFSEIKTEIDNHVTYLTQTLLNVESYIEFEIKNSWIIKHDKGDFAQPHIHANSILSGIFYLQCNKDSGNLVLEKDHNYTNLFPPAIDVPVKERNVFNSKNWTFTPEPGNIFIFPSNLAHSVTTSNADIDRYCIAFNVFPKGTLGLDIGEPLSVLNLS